MGGMFAATSEIVPHFRHLGLDPDRQQPATDSLTNDSNRPDGRCRTRGRATNGCPCMGETIALPADNARAGGPPQDADLHG